MKTELLAFANWYYTTGKHLTPEFAVKQYLKRANNSEHQSEAPNVMENEQTKEVCPTCHRSSVIYMGLGKNACPFCNSWWTK